MSVFYDTHAHLDYPDFAADLPQVVQRANDAGIEKIVCIGTDLESSRNAILLAERFPGVYAAVGWHPTHAMEAPEDIRPALRELARHPKVVAIGETGLDFYRMPGQQPGGTAEDDARYRARQESLFEQQLEVAAEADLNCVIHQRNSFDETLRQIKPYAGKLKAVFHCFPGDVAVLKRVLDLGFLVSFTGILTFKNAQVVRDSLAATPMDRFMLETDSPFLAPVPHRGKRCEPAYVRDIAAIAAEVKNCSLNELSQSTCETAHRFFKQFERL